MDEVVVISEADMEEVEEEKTVVRWEKFLPKMVLRVLLVETDDSTRQIIAALLRKCNYRVAAVSDGLKAWETLKGRPNNIDLVLTEVELPSVSGFALLTLVMEHEICKNIPVIMMSSHDSIGMVLKCMLKGAADFLIKPIRKNELRNLWQHVWRRHTHKVEATHENNTESNHSSRCAVSTQKDKECSENGIDAQGLLQLNCRSDLQDADIKKLEEHLILNKESVIPKRAIEEKSNGLGSGVAPCNEVYNSPSLRLEENNDCAETMAHFKGVKPEKQANDKITDDIHGHNHELVEHSRRAIDLISSFDNGQKCNYGHSGFSNGSDNFQVAPQLELSLRKFCPSISNNEETDERQTLNHSTASAFSWYKNSKTLQPPFPALDSTCIESKELASESRVLLSNQLSEDRSGTFPKHDVMLGKSPKSMTPLVFGQSGQAECSVPNPQVGLIPVSGVSCDNVYAVYGHACPPVLYTQPGLVPTWGVKPACQPEHSSIPTSSSLSFNPEIQNSEQGYSWSDETPNKFKNHVVPEQKRLIAVEEPCHGSPTTTAAEKVTAPEISNDSTIFIHDGLRCMDSDRISQREVALTKFRLKRKDRCYEKKVRYQSRKKLAEQRPRLRGQFVRQAQSSQMVSTADIAYQDS